MTGPAKKPNDRLHELAASISTRWLCGDINPATMAELRTLLVALERPSEDVQRARIIAANAQRFADDRTHLGSLVYVNDLAWALKVLGA
jgi:hypothetical protein